MSKRGLRRRLLHQTLLPAWRYAWAGPWSLLGMAVAVPALMLGARAHRVDGVIEVSGGWLGRRAARGVGPFNVLAITLGHVVLGSSADMLKALRAHELVHVRQYERWGLMFVPAYLADSLWQALCGRHPYRDNRFERPAFAAEVFAADIADVADAAGPDGLTVAVGDEPAQLVWPDALTTSQPHGPRP